jgi:hypothetical protein
MHRSDRGQATVEWSALLLLVAMLFSALAYAVARADTWRLGESMLHSIVCAVRGGCAEEGTLEQAYGDEVAGLVRRYSPNVVYERRSAQLPVDFRRCRNVDCSNGPSKPDETDRSSAGLPVTAFTRVIDRRAGGGALYVQYWFYYPESFTGGIGRKLGPFAHDWPGYHADDWEGVQLMLPANGLALARATAHGGYSTGWTHWTGWYRVSGGSHAGQVVVGPANERTTKASGLMLTPLEHLDGIEGQRFAISPPWLKSVYREPESTSS